MSRKLIVITLLTFALFSTALAKVDPYIEDQEAEWGDFSDPATIWSWDALAVQAGQLALDDDIDVFAITFPEAVEGWEFELMIPVCEDHFEAFFPSVAVIGPGLDVPEADALPFELPKGMGAEVFVEDIYKERYVVDEQRSIQTENQINGAPAYFSTPRWIDIPEAGDYFIAIFEPEGQVGAYMLSLIGGQHDQFGDRSNAELDAAFNTLFDGSWMGQDDCITDLT
jgi:hypothetical protein